MSMRKAYIYENNNQLLVTDVPKEGLKLLWEGYADSPEKALAQFDPNGEWKAVSTGRA